MARIHINDLPLLEDMTPEQLKALFGAGKFKPTMEALEDRLLMTAGPEFFIGSDARDVVTASAADGSAVAVWTEEDASGDFDIKGQRFGADGAPVGIPLNVANQPYKEIDPAVAMNDNGEFAVTWTEEYLGNSIKARFFDALGNVTHEETVASTSGPEGQSSIALDAAGNAIVSYSHRQTTNDDWNVWARTVNPDGTKSESYMLGNDSNLDEQFSSIARTDDGRIAAVYQTSLGDIRMKYMGPSINTNAPVVDSVFDGQDRHPDIAMDADGNGIIVWVESNGKVKAKRFANDGSLAEVPQLIAENASPSGHVSVALTKDGNSFFVAFKTAAGDVHFARYAREGTDDVVKDDGILAEDSRLPDVSVSGNGRFFASYVKTDLEAAYGRFDDGVNPVDPVNPPVENEDPPFENEFPPVENDEPIVDDDDFDIDIIFQGEWDPTIQQFVEAAADRWEQVIVGDLPMAFDAYGNAVADDIIIHAFMTENVDFAAAIVLGVRDTPNQPTSDDLPFYGTLMVTSDAAAHGGIFPIILHEMGHLLGIGKNVFLAKGMAEDLDYLEPEMRKNPSEYPEFFYVNPRYTGPADGPSAAITAYNEARGAAGVTDPAYFIPMEDTGDEGTYAKHWRESVLGNEVMTSYIADDETFLPISAITIGALADLGYEVDFNAADPYTVPDENNKSIVSANMYNTADGADGQSDAINVTRNGANLEIHVNGQLVHTSVAADVETLYVEGTSDNDYITIDADLNVNVYVDGNSGYDRLTINGGSGNDFVDVGRTEIDVNGTTYSFDDVEYLKIDTKEGNSFVTVNTFPMVSTFIARGGNQYDTYDLNTTSAPNGSVYLQGAGGDNTLAASDRVNTWDITSYGYGKLNSNVSFSGMDHLRGGNQADRFAFSTYGYVYGTIDGNGGTDALDYSGYNFGITVNVQSPTTLTASRVGGSVTDVEGVVGSNTLYDTLNGPTASMNWYITGDNSGYLKNSYGYAPFTFSNVESLNGGNDDDTFRFYGAATMSGNVIGRNGIDTLYYISFNSGDRKGVQVDLSNNKATSVNGNVQLIENVTGSKYDDFLRGDDANNILTGYYGNDILLGMGGKDDLRGSYYGRNILVGGDGSDIITGGRYEDLVIGGSTVFETGNDDKLMFEAFLSIRDLWTDTSRNLEQRIESLQKGFWANGEYVALNNKAIIDDGDTDDLNGRYGRDWFWATQYDATDFNEWEDVLN